MQWLTIEVFDGATPASAWERAYHDALIEAAVSFGAVFWDWHIHQWGVVFEFEFADEQARDAFRDCAALRAALDAVPVPVTGVYVYPHRGGGSGARMPRTPRPMAGAGAAEVPVPVSWPEPLEARAVPLLSVA